MAQAVFDEHPIEQYLRDSGEVPELMPGGTVEFAREPLHDSYHIPLLRQWLPRLVRPLVNTALRVLESTGLRGPSPASEFAEKFKYIVISSPLLSSSLASSSTRAPTPTTPGHYAHSRRPSEATTTIAPASEPSSFVAFSIACLIPAAMVQGYLVSGVAILAAIKIYSDGGLFPTSGGDESWSLTLESVEMLVTANNAWDNVVSEALSVLEAEERTCAHPSSPSTMSPALRIALSSSLHTTQTQCDNVRPLLAALTAPATLAQLAEMYAPPSPSPMHASFSPRTRPVSLAPPPPARARTSSAPLAFDKRATWNGSYMPLARGSVNKRHSNLAALLRQEEDLAHQSTKGSSSAPPTPSLEHVTNGEAEEPFGFAALDLHRKRRSARSMLFDGPPLRDSHSPTSPPGSRISTLNTVTHAEEEHGLQWKRRSMLFERHSPASSVGSRFTTLTPSASPSLANMDHALHSALAAKRFAAAHLLALRFPPPRPCDDSEEEGGDAAYWEDVRSVIALLTSTLEDTTARLSEALSQEAEAPASSASESTPSSPPSVGLGLGLVPQSFAPVPSHLARFAAHVDALSAALDDAREHLRASVAALREEESAAKALEQYERLRSELGVALRECERGRGTLVELAQREAARGHEQECEGEGEEEEAQTRDFSSGDSEKTLFSVDERERELETEHGAHESVHLTSIAHDDASAHLMMGASAQHLPPPGIEQVFESLSAAPVPFARERSKLTREERIRLARTRRESGSGSAFVVAEEPRQGREGWGPGGEVVQELKDVIWKVGEQRRKMIERSSSPGRLRVV